MDKTPEERLGILELRMDNSEKLLTSMNGKLDTLIHSKSLVVGFIACVVLFFQTIMEGAKEGIKHLAEFLK